MGLQKREVYNEGYNLKGNEKIIKNNILLFEDIISLDNKIKGELDMDLSYINMTSLYVFGFNFIWQDKSFFFMNGTLELNIG